VFHDVRTLIDMLFPKFELGKGGTAYDMMVI
jgi:hypothetical protein